MRHVNYKKSLLKPVKQTPKVEETTHSEIRSKQQKVNTWAWPWAWHTRLSK